MPWSGRDIINITGANGDDDVSNEIQKVSMGERTMDNWAAARLIDWAAGRNAKETTKDALRQEMDAIATELAGP